MPEPTRRTSSADAAAPEARTFRNDSIPQALTSRALFSGDQGYARYTSGYFRGAQPGVVIRPQSSAEVQEAVRFAARHRDVPLGLFSGGHGISGRSLNTGGIVIALDALDEITISHGSRVRVGPGVRWGQIAKALAPHHLAITSGDYGGVGVGGLATTAGIGWLVRRRGLTIDHLRSVDLVTADGELLHASAQENSDLFWAVRGAGANFGVVVSFEFEAHPVAEQVGFATIAFVPEDIADFLVDWGAAIESADGSVTGSLMMGSSRPGATTAVQAMIVVDERDTEAVLERLQPFAELAPMANQSVQMLPYAVLMETPPGGEPQFGRGEPHGHSGLARHLDHGLATRLAALLNSGSSLILSIRSAGGAVADQPADSAAYAWRDTNFLLATLGGRDAEAEQRWGAIVPELEGMYLSFETDTGDEVLARAFPPAHLDRLRTLKAVWDPRGLFRDNFFIAPAAGPEPAPGPSTGAGPDPAETSAAPQS
ncbi:FAD-binding oxidoreductase [Nesterenkonia halotolerans]|uniref:FAD-binding oxidoreductase n=1 Tax=Nesterenkonia halotolerans TaxID=225325 RepID=UPI003EE5B5F6